MFYDFKFKKVLVVGGAGFIGSAIVSKLLQLKVEVHIIDDLSTGSLSNLPDINSYTFYRGSILDKSFLAQFIDQDFDLAINLASVVGMKLATSNKSKTYEICTNGTRNLIAVMKNIPMIFFSSSMVYGPDHNGPINEKAIIERSELLRFDGGVSGYACGKFDMEYIATNEALKGRKVLIVRPFNIIGRYQLSDHGMVVPTFMKQALNGEPLVVYGDGTQVRSFSCVNTFVDCLFQLMNKNQTWELNKNIINIGCGMGSSITNLAQLVIDVTHSKSQIKYMPYRQIFGSLCDVQYRVPNSSYAESLCENLHWPSLRKLIQNIYSHYVSTYGI